MFFFRYIIVNNKGDINDNNNNNVKINLKVVLKCEVNLRVPGQIFCSPAMDLRLHIGQAVSYISDALLDHHEGLWSTGLIRNTEGLADKRGQ